MGNNDLPLFNFAESYNNADQFYLSRFLCPDPFGVFVAPSGYTTIWVSDMETGRAEKEAVVDATLPFSMYRKKGTSPAQAMARFLKEHGEGKIRVPPGFPLGLARELEAEGMCLEVDGEDISLRRRAKTEAEIEAIGSVQRQTAKAMEYIRSILAGCPVSGGILEHEGRDLTVERLRSLVDIFLIERGLESAGSIIAPGRGGADPHWGGSGTIHTGVPIVVDLFPRDTVTRYHADMSRTFVVGRASNTVRRMHSAVEEAQDAAFERLRPGGKLSEVHGAVCEVFRRRGFGVPEPGKPLVRRGFLHGTGHGLGLDVHETPSVSTGADRFSPGDVVTIEPGLYDRRVGGVRIEDVIALTPGGAVINLTRFDRRLEIV
ncbi:MAG TPA: aminopeptidase P family protein [Proteobacteria bacterium]|nr:xaa-Pro dipeptidase [bacterium BMS3Abin14]HDL53478.1 aminopeptidase P family protein [Pseudomonadota bacterium]